MAFPQQSRHRRLGLTITELLILIALVAAMIAIMVPAVQHSREHDARIRCTNNLKQIGLGCFNFDSTFKRLPPLYGGGVQDGKYPDVRSSLKFNKVWGSTHVFLAPYIEMDSLYKKNVNPDMQIDPSYNSANQAVFPTYVCPADPSLTDGVVLGGNLAGSSYAANAQVFARLSDETLNGGMMYPSTEPNFTDRGAPLSSFPDGVTNIILFTHTYALCGANGQGSAWGYSEGVGKPPSSTLTMQPWSRASYLGQTYMTAANATPFQNQPNPFATKCVPTDPATPHANAMLVVLGDASVRSITPSISPDTWNMACLPLDGNKMPADWE